MSNETDSVPDSKPVGLDRLIAQRLSALDIRRSELVRRWGYTNTAKGLRRLGYLEAGHFIPPGKGMEALATALEVSPDELREASEASQRQIEEARLAAEQQEWHDWCARFGPHAILRTERSRPSPIFLVAFVGAERILRVDFDTSQPRESWIGQVVAKLPAEVVAFGHVTGFFLNCSPDLCVECDRSGNPLREFPKARRPGRAWMEHKDRDITSAWRAVLGAE